MREEILPCWKVLRPVFADRLRADEPMSAHTSWGVGGPADLFVEVHTMDELGCVKKVAAEHKLPVSLIGDGTNVLVLDGGIRGMTVTLRGDFAGVEVLGERLRAGAGAPLASCVAQAREDGLAGLEFAAGIPGTVGGALVGNAGAWGESVGDRVTSLLVWDDDAQERVPTDYTYTYRDSSLRGETVLGCEFGLARDDLEAITRREEERLAAREGQPRGRSAGCVFRNPPDESAGRMIDELGLKGTAVGGATVSPQHANFIVTTGRTKALDILQLIEFVRERVLKAFRLELEVEVQLMGVEY